METAVPAPSDQMVLAQWFPYLSTKVHTTRHTVQDPILANNPLRGESGLPMIPGPVWDLSLE
eukprot:4966626-Ditylum_brightwellii.AAC.1